MDSPVGLQELLPVGFLRDSALFADGFYLHHRGDWRRSEEPSIPMDLSDDERLQFVDELARAAQTGELAAVSALRRCFDEYPALWEGVGNLATQAEYSMIRLAANGNPVVAEALAQKLGSVKIDLRGSSSTALEELLINRVALTWLQLAYLDVMWAQRPTALSAFGVEQLERQ
jgi:hypothetical protein